jgi:hypothetical protein
MAPHEHTRRETPDIQQKRKSQLLGLDRRQRQICPFCVAELMVATAARPRNWAEVCALIVAGDDHGS